MAKDRLIVPAVVLGLALAGIFLSSPAPLASTAAQAKPAEPLQVQETNEAGVVAEFVECKRKEGVLSVRIRFRNTGTEAVDWYLVSGGNYDQLYVTAAAKKYLVLRDSEKVPLASPGSGGYVRVALKPGGSWLWWAKYPAPPADVKKINYVMPDVAPFEDVPITDQ